MLQLRSLRHFLVLARHLNFARAADELGLSQSALSRSIQTLEAQLGTRLFDRDRAAVHLTPQGRRAVERAGVLLADAEALERDVMLEARGDAGRICFGMAPMPARALLAGVMSARLSAAPEVTHEVVVRDVDALWALLIAGDIEFFVSQDGLIPDPHAARADALGHFPLSLIVRAGHPLLAGDADAGRYPLVRASWVGLPIPEEIREKVVGPANIVEDFNALAAITAATDAIWFSSTYSVAAELRSGILRELPQHYRASAGMVRIVMYSLARRSPTALARLLKRALRTQVAVLEREGGERNEKGAPSAGEGASR